MIAGVATTSLMVPAEVIKCNLQIQSSTGVQKYSGPLDVLKEAYRAEGIRGVYRGSLLTLARDVPGSAAYFAAYEGMRRYFRKPGQSLDDLTPLHLLMAGGCAGMANWALILPVDTVKSRYQTAAPGVYRSISHCYQDIVRTQGYAGLFRGVGPIMARAFPANAACFAAFELTMRFLN